MRRCAFLWMAVFFLTGCSIERPGQEKNIILEVAVFEGGFGIEWHKGVARKYEQTHPGIKINLWGDPRVDEKLKPRILRGSPPDAASAILPIWKLIVSGKLYPLDEALDSPAYGQPDKTWRQTFFPGILQNYEYKGKTYGLPLAFGAWVMWYDRRMFREHGWKTPKTWEEFLDLCAKIKAAGIQPIAFQGKYPSYAWGTLLSLFQRITTWDRFAAIQNLEPGAFKDPDFIRAARMLQDLAVNYFQKGCMAMTHTESQLEYVNGRAAMVACGLWLKNEMKNAIPKGFEMDCFAIPPPKDGKGDPKACNGGGGEYFFVFSEAKHPKEAADFLKFMMSRESGKTYVKTLDTLSTIQGTFSPETVSPELKGAVHIVLSASRTFADRLGILYLEWATRTMPTGLAQLVQKSITPEEFAQHMEDAAEKIRKDKNIYKPPPIQYE